MGPPVSGRDCILPQSTIVTKTFPPSGGFGSWPSCWGPLSQVGAVFFGLRSYLRLSLLLAGLVLPLLVGFTLLRDQCEWGLPMFARNGGVASASPLYPSGCGHPLDQVCLFVTLDRERRITLVVVPY